MIKRAVQLLAFSIALIFLGSLFWKYSGELSSFHWRLDYFYLSVAVFMLFSMFLLAVWGWALILNVLNLKISFKKSMEIWVASIIGKYIPGKIWFLLGRVYLAQKLGIPKAKISLATLLEIILMQASAIFVYFISLFFWQEAPILGSLKPLLIIICILCLILMHPRLLEWLINLALKITGRKTIQITVTYRDILYLLFFYMFFWAMFGAAIFFLGRVFYPIPITQLPAICGIWVISVILGVLAFIVPGGLGVREGIFVFLLSFLLPPALTLIIAIFSRILLTVLEIIFIGLLLRFDVSLSKYYEKIKSGLRSLEKDLL